MRAETRSRTAISIAVPNSSSPSSGASRWTKGQDRQLVAFVCRDEGHNCTPAHAWRHRPLMPIGPRRYRAFAKPSSAGKVTDVLEGTEHGEAFWRLPQRLLPRGGTRTTLARSEGNPRRAVILSSLADRHPRELRLSRTSSGRQFPAAESTPTS
jgi:hypothetical protein